MADLQEIDYGGVAPPAVVYGKTAGGTLVPLLLSSEGAILLESFLPSSGEGSIAAGYNYADIGHDLGGTPTLILITPEDGFDAPYEVPKASIGAVTFRVQYKGGVVQPAGTIGYFMWGAKV